VRHRVQAAHQGAIEGKGRRRHGRCSRRRDAGARRRVSALEGRQGWITACRLPVTMTFFKRKDGLLGSGPGWGPANRRQPVWELGMDTGSTMHATGLGRASGVARQMLRSARRRGRRMWWMGTLRMRSMRGGSLGWRLDIPPDSKVPMIGGKGTKGRVPSKTSARRLGLSVRARDRRQPPLTRSGRTKG